MSTDVEEFQVASYGYAIIKGTRHEPRAMDLDADGPAGDRRWCLVDVEKHHVLRTVQNAPLLAVRVEGTGDELTVHIPEMGTITSRPTPTGQRLDAEYWQRPVDAELMDSSLSEAFSDYLGREVRLARPRRGMVVYGDTVSLLTTASLADLGERAGVDDLVGEFARFRPTFLVEHDTPYVEDSWVGRVVRLGDALIRVGVGIGRCAIVDMNPVTGDKDTKLLKTMAGYRPRNKANSPVFAMYGSVVSESEAAA